MGERTVGEGFGADRRGRLLTVTVRRSRGGLTKRPLDPREVGGVVSDTNWSLPVFCLDTDQG